MITQRNIRFLAYGCAAQLALFVVFVGLIVAAVKFGNPSLAVVLCALLFLGSPAVGVVVWHISEDHSEEKGEE